MINPKYIDATERILITLFDSSFSLKNEIRKIVGNRQQRNWDLRSITSEGPYVSLGFRKAVINPEATAGQM